MQKVLNNDTEKYNLVIKNFEGPLDLLLFLITKNKMNIFDISLSELTDKYIEYLHDMTEKNIDIASSFIVMASTLLDIKARKLLPELEPEEDDEEDDRGDLECLWPWVGRDKEPESTDCKGGASMWWRADPTRTAS